MKMSSSEAIHLHGLCLLRRAPTRYPIYLAGQNGINKSECTKLCSVASNVYINRLWCQQITFLFLFVFFIFFMFPPISSLVLFLSLVAVTQVSPSPIPYDRKKKPHRCGSQQALCRDLRSAGTKTDLVHAASLTHFCADMPWRRR